MYCSENTVICYEDHTEYHAAHIGKCHLSCVNVALGHLVSLRALGVMNIILFLLQSRQIRHKATGKEVKWAVSLVITCYRINRDIKDKDERWTGHNESTTRN